MVTRQKISELEKVSFNFDTDPTLIMASVTAHNGFENEGINKYADLVATKDEDRGRQLMEHEVDGSSQIGVSCMGQPRLLMKL